MGAGDDTLTLDYSEGVIDTPLDGGDGDDTLMITLKMTPGDNTPSAADIAAAEAEADGELELPAFTLRWTNFENVQIAYATNSDSEITRLLRKRRAKAANLTLSSTQNLKTSV